MSAPHARSKAQAAVSPASGRDAPHESASAQVLGNLLWRFWLESQGKTATDIHRLDLELQA